MPILLHSIVILDFTLNCKPRPVHLRELVTYGLRASDTLARSAGANLCITELWRAARAVLLSALRRMDSAISPIRQIRNLGMEPGVSTRRVIHCADCSRGSSIESRATPGRSSSCGLRICKRPHFFGEASQRSNSGQREAAAARNLRDGLGDCHGSNLSVFVSREKSIQRS